MWEKIKAFFRRIFGRKSLDIESIKSQFDDVRGELSDKHTELLAKEEVLENLEKRIADKQAELDRQIQELEEKQSQRILDGQEMVEKDRFQVVEYDPKIKYRRGNLEIIVIRDNKTGKEYVEIR